MDTNSVKSAKLTRRLCVGRKLTLFATKWVIPSAFFMLFFKDKQTINIKSNKRANRDLKMCLFIEQQIAKQSWLHNRWRVHTQGANAHDVTRYEHKFVCVCVIESDDDVGGQKVLQIRSDLIKRQPD